MPTMTRFEDLEAWKRSRALNKMICALTEQGNLARDFGWKNHIQRAAFSIMRNIAEVSESRTQAQFVECLGRSKASAGEVRCQLYIPAHMNDLEAHPQPRQTREEGAI